MKIEQVNRAECAPLKVGGREITTGIFKTAQAGRVNVGSLGLEDDAVCNTKHHGGPDQAVYLYSIEDYAWWSDYLGKPVEHGAFGENLTTSGLDLNEIRVGDQLQLPDLLLEVTAPRIPCNTLATRMGDKQFAKKFVEFARSGAYCRVLTEGTVGAGDAGELMAHDGDSFDLPTFFRDSLTPPDTPTVEAYLALPIAERARRDFEKVLAKRK